MTVPNVVLERGVFFSAVIMQVYDAYKHGKFTPPSGYQFIDFIGAKKFPVMGGILESKDEVIIAFRGTEDLVDFLEDVNIVPVDFPYAKDAGHVPKGFLDVYRSMRLRLFQSLHPRFRDKQLYITGHSLGGALSRLLALDLFTNSAFKKPLVLTLASPRIGSEAFVSLYNQSIITNYGIYNKHDPVPSLPPAFKHVKTDVPVSFHMRNPISNHKILNYYHHLCRLTPSFHKLFCYLNPHYCRIQKQK